ncbi:MAG: methionine ABC transporter ATP-binding protein [Polyangiaceae bacterium]
MNSDVIAALEDVAVNFRSGGTTFEAVKEVSLSVRRGEVFGIVGTSGAGKSTVLRLFNLLERPTRGEVWIGEQNVTRLRGLALRELRQRVAMVFQHFNLIASRTVHDNVALALRAANVEGEVARKRVRELLELVELKDKEFSLPGHLSGGQKQRVAIARALANRPEILLCDEPTSALDLETTDSILSLLAEINRTLGVTIIVISHEMSVIKRICHRVAVMKQGRVVEQNGTYELFSRPEDPFTCELVARCLELPLPERLRGCSSGKLVRLLYFGANAEDATISNTVTRFGVTLNILHGRIEYVHDRPIGVLVVSLEGESVDVEAALEELKLKVAKVEVLSHAA